LLDAVGFRPELQECVVSREDIDPEDQYFSYQLGGVVKPGYVHDSPSVIPISMPALKLLRHMQRSTYHQVKALKLGPVIHEEAERILLSYLTYILERKLQSVDFIRRVR
jgi:DNA repair protein RecO (recombination protein O)